jgi:hypothetical protein
MPKAVRDAPGLERDAVAFYSATLFVIALAYNAVWRYAVAAGRLLGADADPEGMRTISRRYLIGPLGYGLSLVLAFVSPWTSLAPTRAAGGSLCPARTEADFPSANPVGCSHVENPAERRRTRGGDRRRRETGARRESWKSIHRDRVGHPSIRGTAVVLDDDDPAGRAHEGHEPREHDVGLANEVKSVRDEQSVERLRQLERLCEISLHGDHVRAVSRRPSAE